MQDTRQEKLTTYFLINIFFIVLFGVIMVFSASYMYAKENMGSSYYFLAKQLVFILIGLGAAWVVSKVKVLILYKQAYFINAFMCFIVSLTLLPGISVYIKGSRRWLNLGFMNLQPGEFLKYSLMLAAIKYFENFDKYSPKQRVLYLTGLLYPLGAFVLQPDFGTFFICSVIIAFIAFLSNFPRKYFYSAVVAGGVGAVAILFAAPYRVKRILAFLDPWQDPRGTGFQIIQSFLAFANGSFTGQGLGNSNEKLFYLPEAYNDFIFSVVDKELGFIGVMVTIMMFISFTFIGFKLAISLKSRVGQILCTTIIFSISFQAFLNMGVVLGVLPTKGLNLPFISYGGSSMVANLVALGFFFACLRIKNKDQKILKTVNESEALATFNKAFGR